MSGAATRRTVAAAVTGVVLSTSALTAASPAAAIAPVRVDPRYLPDAAPPAPRATARQSGACTAPELAVGRDLTGVTARATGYDLPAIWRLSRGRGQRVAVLDTGVAPHRRLPSLHGGGDYVAGGSGVGDCDGHGTLVAGLIGGRPSTADGFSGIAPDVEILSIRQSSEVYRTAAGTDGIGDVATMAMAVRTAADAGATVINISSVACAAATAGFDDRSLGAAVAYAVDVRDAVVVAAAGNADSSPGCVQQHAGAGQLGWQDVTVAVSPGWYDDYVLTVGSAAPDGTPSEFSMAGPWVDLIAPGEQVVSLSADGAGLADSHDQNLIAGTSFAAPLVSGVAALVRARFPALTARQVMSRIERTAIAPADGWDARSGHGLLDAAAAVTATGVAADPPTATAGRPVVLPPHPGAAPQSRSAALLGVAVCAAIVAVALALPTVTGRRPPRRGPSARSRG